MLAATICHRTNLHDLKYCDSIVNEFTIFKAMIARSFANL
jgi:hypothetical protein